MLTQWPPVAWQQPNRVFLSSPGQIGYIIVPGFVSRIYSVGRIEIQPLCFIIQSYSCGSIWGLLVKQPTGIVIVRIYCSQHYMESTVLVCKDLLRTGV